MRKLLILLFFPLQIFAQAAISDTTKMLPRVDTSKVYTEFNVLSKNVWRGVDFGSQLPTVQLYFTYDLNKKFALGTFASATITQEGYGNTLNLFALYRVKSLTFFIDDYYFEGDATNLETDFFNFKGCHLVEARVKYEHEKFELLGGYTLYGGNFYSTSANDNGVYLEATVNLIHTKKEKLQFIAGGITAPSALNFHDRAGVTNIGFKYLKPLKIGDLWTQLVANPNFDAISPINVPRVGYGNSMLNFIIGITIK
jgi:hypothetical protein